MRISDTAADFPVASDPLTVMCVAGARPNFPKLKPVIAALEARGVRTVLVHTGQHYDAAMSDVFFAELGPARPTLNLGVGSGTPRRADRARS